MIFIDFSGINSLDFNLPQKETWVEIFLKGFEVVFILIFVLIVVAAYKIVYKISADDENARDEADDKYV